MVDLDKLRGTAEGFSKSQKGTRAAIAATVTLSGNLNAQTVEHSQDEIPNGTETKVQNSERQNTSEDKTADFATEAAQMGIKIDTAAVVKPQEDISYSKDTAVVQDVCKNGNIKESILGMFMLCFNKMPKFLSNFISNYPKTSYYLCAIGWILCSPVIKKNAYLTRSTKARLKEWG